MTLLVFLMKRKNSTAFYVHYSPVPFFFFGSIAETKQPKTHNDDVPKL